MKILLKKQRQQSSLEASLLWMHGSQIVRISNTKVTFRKVLSESMWQQKWITYFEMFRQCTRYMEILNSLKVKVMSTLPDRGLLMLLVWWNKMYEEWDDIINFYSLTYSADIVETLHFPNFHFNLLNICRWWQL